MMNLSAGPKVSPPAYLRVHCARVLPRLQLIPELKPWLQIALETSLLSEHRKITPYITLWNCFALGAPLCVLLDLLGAPSSHAHEDLDHDNGKLSEPERLVKTFIDGVRLLEIQGRLSFGEVFRGEDLFNGTHQGFAKALRTVDRVLRALQDTYPGLYFLPPPSSIIRSSHLEELIDSERAHVDLLAKMREAAEVLAKAYSSEGTVMACLAMYLERLLQYHNHILMNLDKTLSSPHLQEDWDNIFALDQATFRALAFGAQRSYCVHYLTALNFLKDKLHDASATSKIHIQLLLDHLSEPLHRICDHRRLLQSILELTIPTNCASYDSICIALHNTSEMADQIDEVGLHLRTMNSTGSLQARIEYWDGIGTDPGQLGLLVLDDLLLADVTSGLQHSVFLYESMLLCCQDSITDVSALDRHSFPFSYPIANWELGPAISRNQPLDILFAIPTSLFKSVRRVSAGGLEIDWVDHDILHTHSFTALFIRQCDQWYLTLQGIVPRAQNVLSLDLPYLMPEDPDESVLLDDDDFGGRRTAHPRPWSLVGRKKPRSESSSMILQEYYEYGLPQSPNMLPSLFYDLHSNVLRSPSPSCLSFKSIFSQRNDEIGILDQLPPTPPDSIMSNSQTSTSTLLVDLTGKIAREGKYPCAHGGFADVWKGTWHRESGDNKVAIKVLRSRTDDPETEAKMHKRLRRELHVWQRLNHENILPLLGTVSDFGHYTAFVCPWLENGSVSRYLERCGGVLSLMDCLQLLCEVAAGLSYLHSFSVIHGDLTGSNILIDDEGKACLCDFGLSSIAADFQGTSFLTSTIGGNVRWAAPELYCTNEDDSTPTVTTHSDIYSFGSVMLEILSGHVPYSYLLRDAQVIIEVHKGVKPRRPTTPLVTNQLWCFINTCWADEPNDRPNITEVLKSMQNFLRGNRRNTS